MGITRQAKTNKASRAQERLEGYRENAKRQKKKKRVVKSEDLGLGEKDPRFRLLCSGFGHRVEHRRAGCELVAGKCSDMVGLQPSISLVYSPFPRQPATQRDSNRGGTVALSVRAGRLGSAQLGYKELEPR